MRRLVVAVAALVGLAAAAGLAGYLLFFSTGADRLARAAPADSAVFVSAYLQPSTAQKMNLFGLIARLPGFRDTATLDEKLHDVAQRLLGDAGIDYAADLRPWLGNEVAVAVAPRRQGSSAARIILLAAVKDPQLARAGVPRLMARDGVAYSAEEYRGHAALMSATISYSLLDDLLIVGSSPDSLRAALDAEAGGSASLAASGAFKAAVGTIPADRLASLYVNPGSLVAADGSAEVAGYGAAALAVTARADGLHLDGSVPFSGSAAGEMARAAFALAARPASLAAWMPRDTVAEVDLFGLQQGIAQLEAAVGADPAIAAAADALNQLRAVAAIGLGINADRDLLPLLDGEAAVALAGLGPHAANGQLLLHPRDGAAARAALDRMRDALLARGSTVTTASAAGTTITLVRVPAIGQVAYAMDEAVLVLGFDAADVAASLEAHAAEKALVSDPRYRAAFDLAGTHSGHEIWVDLPGLQDAVATFFDPGGELRDILHQFGVLAMSASAVGDHMEIHAVLTVK